MCHNRWLHSSHTTFVQFFDVTLQKIVNNFDENRFKNEFTECTIRILKIHVSYTLYS